MKVLKCQCKDCKGTGLYVGMAERDGSAIVCHTCKGTGEMEINYEPFIGRKEKQGVKRVYQRNPGICIGVANGKFSLEYFGGMPFMDWLAGKPFPEGHEMRRFTCPYWWYGQSKESKCRGCEDNLAGSRYPDCPHFANKDECWKEFDNKGGSR